MRLIQLTDSYMLDLDRLQEVFFTPSDGVEPARTELLFVGDKVPTIFEADEAITVWHRLRDLCAAAGGSA